VQRADRHDVAVQVVTHFKADFENQDITFLAFLAFWLVVLSHTHTHIPGTRVETRRCFQAMDIDNWIPTCNSRTMTTPAFCDCSSGRELGVAVQV
jgi:hypothetical protein